MQTDSTNSVIQQMMTTQAPTFSNAEAAAIAARHYGIDAQAHPLVSERDQNFRLDGTDSKRYMLKFSNHAEQSMIVDFQNCALQHAGQQDPSLPLPRVIPDLQGASYCSVEKDGQSHFVRILSWLDGRVLGDGNTDADLSNRLGRLLAQLGLAFKDFDHPGSNPPSLWDMKRASGLRDLLPYIEEAGLRQMIEDTLNRFDSHVKPRLGMLRTQVIHNDLNLGNVLMDKAQKNHISGIIDFGDIVKSPLVFDLAIASAYQLSDDDPLRGALPMIAGYHALRELQNLEIELLTDLIRTRLITSLLIGSYRVSLFPENREYLTISHKPAINCLTKLQDLGNGEAIQRIRDSFSKT